MLHTLEVMDDYAKDGRPGEVQLLCSFYHDPLRTWIETNVNKFAISKHKALKIDLHTLRSYLRLICEYELYILSNKVSAAKDHGKNYMRDKTTPVSSSFASWSIGSICNLLALLSENSFDDAELPVRVENRRLCKRWRTRGGLTFT